MSCYYIVYEFSKLCNLPLISICDIYIALYIVWQHMSTQFPSSLWKRKCIEMHFCCISSMRVYIKRLEISAYSLQGTQINTVGLGQWTKTYYRRHILVKTDGVKYTACDLYTNMKAYIFTMPVCLYTLNIILMVDICT